MSEPKNIEGFLLINKPKDITSFFVVNKIKKLIGIKTLRVGHGGTLDPFATGILIIGIGRTATRHLGKLLNQNKKYEAQGKLGELTDTLDYTGTIIQTTDYLSITKEQILESIALLGTSYIQTPPAYSALKHQGLPLYTYARTKQLDDATLQKVTQAKQREIQLHELNMTDLKPPYFSISAHVSHGTYIRVLVNDIAQKAGSYATTYQLARTAIGSFTLNQTVPFEQLTNEQEIINKLVSIEEFLRRL